MAKSILLKGLVVRDQLGNEIQVHEDRDKYGCLVELPNRFEFIAATAVKNTRLGSVDASVTIRSKFFLPTNVNYLSLRTKWVRVQIGDRAEARRQAHDLVATMIESSITSVSECGDDAYTGGVGRRNWSTLVHELVFALLVKDAGRAKRINYSLEDVLEESGVYSSMPSPPAFPGFAYSLAASDYQAFSNHVHNHVRLMESHIRSGVLRVFD